MDALHNMLRKQDQVIETNFLNQYNFKQMKFETTTTEKRQIEIPVPSFYKDAKCHQSINDMVGILDEKTIVRVWESEKRTSVENSDVDLNSNELVRAFQNYAPISEEEFMTAYNRALNSMSLAPQLVQSTTNDDEKRLQEIRDSFQ